MYPCPQAGNTLKNDLLNTIMNISQFNVLEKQCVHFKIRTGGCLVQPITNNNKNVNIMLVKEH